MFENHWFDISRKNCLPLSGISDSRDASASKKNRWTCVVTCNYLSVCTSSPRQSAPCEKQHCCPMPANKNATSLQTFMNSLISKSLRDIKRGNILNVDDSLYRLNAFLQLWVLPQIWEKKTKQGSQLVHADRCHIGKGKTKGGKTRVR